ncbi:MAG TPA: zinc ABC transporter substrate-binding protein [Streptosporangiaceae bacterium]|nr:zinc ABC transporter substrate-binding protein [Streptosporangiaceae bacterium]
MSLRRMAAVVATTAAMSMLAAACASSSATSTATARSGVVVAVGAESQYANVISQIGGRYVRVTAVENNPNSDPHSFEASASVSQAVGAAELIVQNGIGYDSYMNTIESGSPNPARRVIDVAHLLGRPDSTPNPHLWYSPATMPAVARAIAGDLSKLRPAHQAYFQARLARFDASLRPWLSAIASFKAARGGTPVATTEPVAGYLLAALGTRDLTPFGLQADIMNGVDLPPQYVTLQDKLLQQHKVKVLVYNQQVVDSVTQAFLAAARSAGIPVVGVYETMPAGYSYQSWMLAEVHALQKAVTGKGSTEKL